MAGASAQPTQARLRMTQKARSAAGMVGRRLAAKVANCCRYGSAVAFAASGVLALAAAQEVDGRSLPERLRDGTAKPLSPYL